MGLHQAGDLVISRVLQGSILGPFLFSVFRNDLGTGTECTLSLPTILNQEELLTPSRVERPYREIWID